MFLRLRDRLLRAQLGRTRGSSCSIRSTVAFSSIERVPSSMWGNSA